MITIEIFHTVLETAPRHVATLTSHDSSEVALEEVFEATQNECFSWVLLRGQNGVTVTPSEEVLSLAECRSTTAGDYARVIQNNGATFWRCTFGGWEQITNLDEVSLTGSSAMAKAVR